MNHWFIGDYTSTECTAITECLMCILKMTRPTDFEKSSFPDSSGEVSPVLARWALCQVSVLCGGPHGGVQHAAVHPPGVQSYRCQGRFSLLRLYDASRLCNLIFFLFQLQRCKRVSDAERVVSTCHVLQSECFVRECVRLDRFPLLTRGCRLLVQPCCLQITLAARTCVCARSSCDHVPVIDNSS